VDESHLTGESDEVSKEQCSSQALYSGSKLLSGVGFMLVTGVGSNSQSGMIADMISGENNGSQMALNLLDEETVLQKRLAAYASTIGIFGVAAAVTTTLIMSGKFTLDTFILGESTWHIDYLEQYLEFFITGVTILVLCFLSLFFSDASLFCLEYFQPVICFWFLVFRLLRYQKGFLLQLRYPLPIL
jgi:Ca2+ transporting ATPase